MILCITVTSAFAAEDIDDTRLGSIEITVKYENTALTDGTITLYRICDICKDDSGNYVYVLTEELSSYPISAEQVTDLSALKELVKHIEKNNIKGMKKEINEQGTVMFENLETGLYLIIQEDHSTGFMPMNPFVISLPMEGNGKYVYDVECEPKSSLQRDEEETTSPEPTTKPNVEELPLTGLTQWPIPVMIATGFMMIVIGACMVSSSKKRKRR